MSEPNVFPERDKCRGNAKMQKRVCEDSQEARDGFITIVQLKSGEGLSQLSSKGAGKVRKVSWDQTRKLECVGGGD